LNQISQRTPFGNLQYGTDATGRTTADFTFSPAQQDLLRRQQHSQRLGAGAAGQFLQGFDPSADMFGGMPGVRQLTPGGLQGIGMGAPGRLDSFDADAFSADRGRVEQATFDRAMGLLNPQFERREENLQRELANRGLPDASRGARARTGDFQEERSRAEHDAALASILAGGAEQSRMHGDMLAGNTAAYDQAMGARQQGFGERAAGADADLRRRELMGQEAAIGRTLPFDQAMGLLGMSRPQLPEFTAPGPVGVQDMRSQSPGFFQSMLPGAIQGGSGALTAFLLRSDRRLKKDIRRVGQLESGVPVYTFRYRDDPNGAVQMGVMAQELREVQPEAVEQLGDGFLAVDYSRIG